MKIQRRNRTVKITKDITRVLSEKREGRQRTIPGYLSTGCTMLNLACSDNPFGGFKLGKIANIIGDSSSGKTLLSLGILTEAGYNKRFQDYRLIYDDVEAASEFNIPYLFGEKIGKRIEKSIVSDTIESFEKNVLQSLKGEKPFIYVLDSLDALTSKDEQGRANKMLSPKSSEKQAGSYKMEKAKIISEILRVIARDLQKTESFLIIISQTRDNIGVTFGSKKTRSGGKALRFYSSYEIWLAVEKAVKKNGLPVGQNIICRLSKNKITGKHRTIKFPVFYDYGVDSIGSCVDFMVDMEWWKKKGGKIVAEDLDVILTREKLIHYIENNSLERKLNGFTRDCWADVEERAKLNRKRKYSL